jgi:hypothetical protein
LESISFHEVKVKRAEASTQTITAGSDGKVILQAVRRADGSVRREFSKNVSPTSPGNEVNHRSPPGSAETEQQSVNL